MGVPGIQDYLNLSVSDDRGFQITFQTYTFSSRDRKGLRNYPYSQMGYPSSDKSDFFNLFTSSLFIHSLNSEGSFHKVYDHKFPMGLFGIFETVDDNFITDFRHFWCVED